MSLNKLDDSIISSFANGDKNAFIAIYNSYHQVVFNNIARIIAQTDVVEDVLQEVFLKLWEYRHKFQDEHGVSSWLFSVSYNQSISHIRKLIREKKYIDFKSSDINFENVAEAEVELLKTIKENILVDAIDQLPSRKKQAFELCKLQGKTYAEAAEIMNISLETVKEHIAFSLKFVRRYVMEHYKNESLLFPIIISLYLSM